MSAELLLRRLRERLPGVPVYLSTTTAGGRQVAEEKLAELSEGVFWLPFDFSFAIRRCLRTIRPRVVIIMETEIWPNLFRLSKRSGAGLMVINGRMSDLSAPRYASLRWFFSAVLREPDRIVTQSAEDRDRFLAAGASDTKISIGGNLKYDFSLSRVSLAADIERFLHQESPTPVVVAGSTREKEEGPIVEAFQSIAQDRPRALLVLAPRHPGRFEEVAETIKASGLPLVRRSRLREGVPKDLTFPSVVLLDSVGELAVLYGRADLVFVGGSLNGWGGHNLLEPALQGCPVVVGPHMHNFRAVTKDMLRDNAILQIGSSRELAKAFEYVLSDPQRAGDLGERARNTGKCHSGSTDRTSIEVEKLYRAVSIPQSMGGVKTMILSLPAKLWKVGTRIHAGAHKFGIRKNLELDTFTLCVGNITVGGTGKTPTVMWLVEALCAAGLHPAVLTRGYRRIDKDGKSVVMSDKSISPLIAGDETQLLLRRFRQKNLSIAVGVGTNRYQTGRCIESTQEPDLFVLDDGFQHYRLRRDFDLVLIDVDDPFGGGEVLPLGRLREPLSGLTRASAFLLTRVQSGRHYSTIEERLRRWNRSAPIYRSSVETTVIREVATGKDLSLDSLSGLGSLAFAGLGNADSFFRAVKGLGVMLTKCLSFPDHHKYKMQDIDEILTRARNDRVQFVITTEKDLVNMCHAVGEMRLAEDGLESSVAKLFGNMPLLLLGIETRIDQGERLIQNIVEAKWTYDRPKG